MKISTKMSRGCFKSKIMEFRKMHLSRWFFSYRFTTIKLLLSLIIASWNHAKFGHALIQEKRKEVRGRIFLECRRSTIVYRGRGGGFFAISKVPGQWWVPSECDVSHLCRAYSRSFSRMPVFSLLPRVRRQKKRVFRRNGRASSPGCTRAEKDNVRDWKSVYLV